MPRLDTRAASLLGTDAGEAIVVTIEDCGPKISGTNISRLEIQLGSSLPAGYREFLLANNGGRPSPDTIDISGFPESPTDVQELFGVDLALESSCLEWNLRTLAARLEEGLLPIGCDSGGSVFCLSLRPTDMGAVLYCDLQSVYADFEASPGLYSVAATFEEFLEKLRPFS